MANIITPQSISGFPEHLPEVRMVEQKLLDIIRKNYELAGFVNIETPAVERTEVLVSKWANDKEIYTVWRLHAEDEKKEDKLALHFDLTVPMARYVAQHYSDLTFPFRRYQIQKVWRGERAQGWRYREFYQADIDIIGDGDLPISADVEVLTTINNTLSDLDIGQYTIRVNNRKVIVGFVKSLWIEDDDEIMEVIKIIDKIQKIWELEVGKLLSKMGISEWNIDKVTEFCNVSKQGGEKVLEYLRWIDHEEVQNGLSELETVYRQALLLGMDPKHIMLDPSIARGLGYYTGTIYETFLDGHEWLGSICSGGRYDNLASYFTEKKLPWVGVSIGVSRLLSRLVQMEKFNTNIQTPSQVLVTRLQSEYEAVYLQILGDLRKTGIPSEIYLGENVKIGKQLGYANKKWIPYAIVAGGDEISTGEVQLKHMNTGDKEQVVIENISGRIKELLAQS